MLIYNELTKIVNVKIKGKKIPTVGNYIYEIKKTQTLPPPEDDTEASKIILIFYKKKLVGEVTFKGENLLTWVGNPRLFWGCKADICYITDCKHGQYVFEIFTDGEKEEESVTVHPILPSLLEAIKLKLCAKKE